MTNEQKETMIRQYIAAYNAFDVKGMTALLDDGVVFKNVSAGEINAYTKGIEAFTELANQAKGMFSTRSQTPGEFQFSDAVVKVDIAFYGVLSIDLPNGLAAGEALSLNGSSEFEFDNGKISKITDIS